LTGDGKLFRWGYGVSGLEGFAIASFLILGSGLFFMFFAGLYVTLKLLSGKHVKKTAYRRSSPPL